MIEAGVVESRTRAALSAEVEDHSPHFGTFQNASPSWAAPAQRVMKNWGIGLSCSLCRQRGCYCHLKRVLMPVKVLRDARDSVCPVQAYLPPLLMGGFVLARVRHSDVPSPLLKNN